MTAQPPVEPPETPPTEGGGEDLAVKMAKLQSELQQAKTEAQKQQSRADKLESQQLKLIRGAGSGSGAPKSPPARPGAVPSARTGQTRTVAQRLQDQGAQGDDTEPDPVEELAQLAESQQKELMLLRAMAAEGLTAEEVGDIEFSSPQELQVQITLIKQRKEIEELKKSRDVSQEGGSGLSDVRVDTGGVAAQAGRVVEARVLEADKLRTAAKDLRKAGKQKQSVWLALRAAHRDPNKAVPVTAQDIQETS